MQLIKVVALGLVTPLAAAACAKSSDSSNNASDATATSAATAASNAMETTAAAGGNASGAKVYQTDCSSCHQADGKGVPGSFPPLAGNAVVTGDPTKVIHIVKYGLNGKIDVAGHAFNGIMPPWGSQLSNADIAAAITYVRSSWGNNASAVTEAAVSAVPK